MRKNNPKGFTLIEIIIVCSIAAILGLVTTVNIAKYLKTTGCYNTALMLANDINYQKKLAEATQGECGIFTQNKNEYYLYKEGDLNKKTKIVNIRNNIGVKVDLTNLTGNSSIYFNIKGIPLIGNPSSGTVWNGGQILQLSADSSTQIIYLTKEGLAKVE